MSKINDVTGDKIINTKGDKKKYDEGYDKIFGKSNKDVEDLVEMFKRGPTETTTLSNEDFDKLCEMLDNPPSPTEKLKEIWKKIQEKGYEDSVQ